MASEDDEPTPRSPMTYCEMFEWFFGKSRFDAQPDRCAECPANATAHAAECARRCGSDGEGD